MEHNNLTKLLEINKDGVVKILNTRFNNDVIYTNIDDILIAINPYKNLDIYNYDNDSPHIYDIARSSLKNIEDTGKNQTILVSGYSGAGKTFSTKCIINYFAHHFSANEELCEQIINANPIIEVFGNARTIMNDNSSRFGKFINIYFDKYIKKIEGIQIDTYLLEKSRVCYQNKNDFNFHIFNQLSQHNQRHYKYCENKYNYQTLDDTIRMMLKFGFTSREISDIINLMNLIMEIGEYNGNNTIDWGKYIDLPEFEKFISTREIKAGKDLIIKKLEGQELEKNKFTIATQLYEIAFHYIIDRINLILNPNSSKNKFIGLLDIFGFEIFDKNNFEQLCINYTNEKLQNYHNYIIFQNEQELYKQEGINWEIVEYKDNTNILNVFENKFGIINLLDEECILTKSSDSNFHLKMQNMIKSNVLKIKTDNNFLIHHYAGDVQYNCVNFCEKNKQKITKELLKYFEKSSNLILSHSSQKLTKSKSIIKSFSKELTSLMKKIEKTNSSFIKCIKPNNKQQGNKYEDSLVYKQLLFSGIFETIEISRLNYPIRYPILKFYEKYDCIMSEANLKQYTLKDIQFGHTTVFMRSNVYKDLQKLYWAYKNKCATKIQALWRKYYIRKWFLNFRFRTIKIQAYIRMFIQRTKYQRIRNGIIKIQKYYRMKEIRKEYIKKKRAAITIQSFWKGYIVRKNFKYLCECTLIIQKTWRMYSIRKLFLKLRYQTICFQRIWREKQRIKSLPIQIPKKPKIHWPKSTNDSPSVFYISSGDLQVKEELLSPEDLPEEKEIEIIKNQYEDKIQKLESENKKEKLKRKQIKVKMQEKLMVYEKEKMILSSSLSRSQVANRELVDKMNDLLIQNYNLARKYEEEKKRSGWNKIFHFFFN